MSYLKRCLKELYIIEGFKSDHPDDVGGLTTYGIAKNYWPQYYKKWGGPPNRTQAGEFYEAEFWGPMGLEQIHDPRVAFEMFEQSVNLGIRRASKFAQQAVNLVKQTRRTLVVDGQIGAKSIVAINRMGKADTLRFLSVLNGVQFMYYLFRTNQTDHVTKLFRTSKRDDQRTFFRGWLKRIEFSNEA